MRHLVAPWEGVGPRDVARVSSAEEEGDGPWAADVHLRGARQREVAQRRRRGTHTEQRRQGISVAAFCILPSFNNFNKLMTGNVRNINCLPAWCELSVICARLQ